MLRLLAGTLATALLLPGAPSIKLVEEHGKAIWIAEGCLSSGVEPADVFSVYVDDLDGAPPMAGGYRVRGRDVVFQPRYPPAPGVRYRAECNNPTASSTAVFEIPASDRTPTTAVKRIYPSSDELPENLLKFYIHFTAPMSKGEAYRRVRLLDENGEAVELPFLEIDEELWDPNFQRLTLLFDPGRIKSGLVPNQEVGSALRAGRSYSLEIDSGWLDADGKRLRDSHVKRFSVVAADAEPPNPETWRVSAPAGGAEPVVLEFPKPLDQALLSRVLEVKTASGKAVEGGVEIDRGETRWSFIPAAPWIPGRYRIEAMTILEDLAGNSLNRPFEVDVFEKVAERVAHETVSIPFAVGRN